MDSAGLKRRLSGFVFELRSSFLETIRSERLSAGFSAEWQCALSSEDSPRPDPEDFDQPVAQG
jgi:hypothetical protein